MKLIHMVNVYMKLTQFKVLKDFAIFLISLLLISCESTKEPKITEIENFPEEKTLIGEVILKDEIKGFSIQILDTLLLLELDGDEHVWSIYGINNLERLGHLGRRGDFRNSFIAPKFSYQFASEYNEYKLWLYDSRKYQLRKVPLFKSLKNDELVIETEINIKPKSGLDQFVFYLSDTLLIGNQGYQATEKSRLKGYNPKTDEIIYDSGLYPKLVNGEQMIGPQLYFIYMDYLALTPKGEFISAMSRFDRIDLFTKDLQLYKTITNGNYVDEFDAALMMNGEEPEEGFFYYMGIFAGKNQFYALYRNQKESDYYKISNQTEIHVFDYNGKPLQKLIIPDYLISFTVDEKNEILYGVDHLNEKILKYKI